MATLETIEAKLTEYKLSKARVSEIMQMISELKASSSARDMQETKIVDGIEFKYCRWHQKWEPASRFVYYKGKSKGYCRAAYSVWSRNNNEIKKLSTTALAEAVAAGNFDEATKIQAKIAQLKADLNKPSSFDIIDDWHNRKIPEEAIYLNDNHDTIIKE